MAIYHRTQRLQIYGDKPEVTQLFGGRYRIEVRCVAAKDTEAWYNANKDQIFADFGTLYSAEMSIDGIGPRVGEAYANMVLISNNAGYTPTGEYVISFVYETLTGSWVKEKEDVISSTDNGLRTLTRTQVAKIDTAAPYDEDNVGAVSITDNGKTLYLAGFENQTKTDDEVQIGRFITRWAEPGIVNLQTTKVGGEQRVVVDAIQLTELAVETELSAFLPNHEVVDVGGSNYDGLQTLRYTFSSDDFEVRSQTENGLKLITQTELSTSNFTDSTIGAVGTGDYASLYRAGEEIDNDNTIKRRVTRWAEAGVLDISKEFRDGLLYVTFNSQGTKFTPTCLNSPTYALTDDPLLAFQGGTAAVVLFDRQRNVNGFRIYTVTSVMKKDGGTLGTSSVINQRTTWENYEYPGYVDTSFTSGIVPVPGGNIPVRVTVTETLTTSNTVGTSDIPFAIKQGCYVNVNFIPTKTGLAQSVNKTFGTNYLAGSIGLSGSNTTFLGMPVSSIAGGGSSNPTYANFLIESNPILAREIKEDFITDSGVQWYRIVQVQLVGTFGDYD